MGSPAPPVAPARRRPIVVSLSWLQCERSAYADEPFREHSRAAGATDRRPADHGRRRPALADLTDRVLFGEVWERPQLSPRDRSLVTVSALIAMNRPDHLRSHLARARANGVTQEELIEAITHLAFYSGWPNAVTAVGVAPEVFANAETPPRP